MVARVFLVEKATRQFSDRKFLCPWQSSKFSKIFTSLSFCIETKVLDKVQFFKIPFHLGSVWQIYKYQTGVSSLSWAHSHLLSRITTILAHLYIFSRFASVFDFLNVLIPQRCYNFKANSFACSFHYMFDWTFCWIQVNWTCLSIWFCEKYRLFVSFFKRLKILYNQIWFFTVSIRFYLLKGRQLRPLVTKMEMGRKNWLT